jgi:hypothetical protein
MGIESFAEFLANDLESDRLPVILHEYAHFMFSTIPKEKGLQLKASVIKAGGVFGGTLWGLLNEAQASALGNGRVARSYMSAERFGKYEAANGSFYANNLIDGAGKALLPVFDEMLANRKSIIGVEMNETQAPLIVIAANDNAGATAALEALMKEPTLVTKVWATGKK